ncbi:MAG: fimbria/pilus periplasmic chaperone [Gammaproteobacteria bacterium]|nr:fimbria/pilus periplasmic chaperone [Gammaproteobacteria bacterium]
MLLFRTSLILVLLMFVSTFVHASTFKVHPLRFQFDGEKKSDVLKLTNTSDNAVTVQLESVKWAQDSAGNDLYEPTQDIIFFPKIVTLEKDQQRIVRIGYRGEPALKHEKFYRLFAQELPGQGQKQGALNFSFRFSMPIFIKAKQQQPKHKITRTSVRNGAIHVTMENTGNSHYLVKKIFAVAQDQSQTDLSTVETSGWYILPGVERTFTIPLQEADCRAAKQYLLAVQAGKKTLHSQTSIDAEQCKAIARKKTQVAGP